MTDLFWTGFDDVRDDPGTDDVDGFGWLVDGFGDLDGDDPVGPDPTGDGPVDGDHPDGYDGPETDTTSGDAVADEGEWESTAPGVADGGDGATWMKYDPEAGVDPYAMA